MTRRPALERVRTRDLFSRIVPEDVVDVVLASADGLRLEGVQRDGTVMLSDLHGFISVAESTEALRSPRARARVLRRALDPRAGRAGEAVVGGRGCRGVTRPPVQASSAEGAE